MKVELNYVYICPFCEAFLYSSEDNIDEMLSSSSIICKECGKTLNKEHIIFNIMKI